jgi:steroid 5-alpha reductase family enzyme
MRSGPDRRRRRTGALPGTGCDHPDVDVANLRVVAAGSALTVSALQAVTAALGLRAGRRDYADVVWGPGLAAVAVVGAVAGTGNAPRRWSLAAIAAAWSARLSHQLLGRIRAADEEDPRYTEFLEGDGAAKVVLKVFVTQGLAQLIVSAPVQLAAASQVPRSARRRLAIIGPAVMVAGGAVEALADRQKSRYSEMDDEQRPDVLDTGLWGLSRHPNYFGDSLVWDGAWLTAAASAPGALTFPAPALMSYLLMFATGAERTERRMQDRSGYRDYQRRVAFFFPWPQRARPGRRS